MQTDEIRWNAVNLGNVQYNASQNVVKTINTR